VFLSELTIDDTFENELPDDEDFNPGTISLYDDTSDVEPISDDDDDDDGQRRDTDTQEDMGPGEWQPNPDMALATFLSILDS
jgi:hypothetical protein